MSQWFAVLLVAFVLLLASMDRDVGRYDEGIILFGAIRILNGDVPYRDFSANYGPAQFYVVAALFKAFGPSILVARMWDLLVRAAITTVVYVIVSHLGNRRAAAITAAVVLAWLAAAFPAYGYPVFPCLLFALLSLLAALPAYCDRPALVPLLLSGACVAVVALFRYDVGIMAAAAHIVPLVLVHQTPEPHHPRRRLAALTAFVGGIALIAGPLWSLVLVVGSPSEVIRDLVDIPRRTYVEMRSLPFPSVPELAADLVHLRLPAVTRGAVFLPPIAALFGGLVGLGLVGGGPTRHGMVVPSPAIIRLRRSGIMLLSSFCIVFFFKGVVRVSLVHMALAIIPALLLMVVCSTALWATDSWRARSLALLLASVTAVISLTPIVRTILVLHANVTWAAHPARASSECHRGSGLERLGCFRVDADLLDAVRLVQARTASDEPIFVGLPRHDRIFANDVLFYFLSKRPSATKWHHFDPGVQTSREIQAEMIAEFTRRKPRLIVLTSVWEDVREPNGSNISSGVTILDEFIRGNYHPEATFGSTQVLLPRGEEAPSGRTTP